MIHVRPLVRFWKKFFRFCLSFFCIFSISWVGLQFHAASASASGQTELPVQSQNGLIVSVGDSLTAGLGVAIDEAYPAQLEVLLRQKGYHYRVVNAGISGETSSGTRERINWLLRLKPQIVILETGANDGLRGIEPHLIASNLRAIIEELVSHDVVVVFTGMRMLTNLGPEYVADFNRIYPETAAAYPVIFMPFFLEGVAADKRLNQADGIHPTKEGYRIIAGNLLPYVEQAISDYEKRHRLLKSEKQE